MFDYSILAKSLVHYIFRSGVIEEYHHQGCLSDEQMKAINIQMVNRLGFYFKLIEEERDYDISILLGFHSIVTRSWNNPCYTECEAELAKIKELVNDDIWDINP